jgi:hypothetical protein
MEQVYALFDRRCRTQTALDKLAKLRRRLLRFPQVGETLKKLFSPTWDKALTFLDDKLLPPPPQMPWSGATGAIARGKRVSTGCGRKSRSVRVLRWICGVKLKPKAVNKPSPHSIVHGLNKPGVFTTVSPFRLKLSRCCFSPSHTMPERTPVDAMSAGITESSTRTWLRSAAIRLNIVPHIENLNGVCPLHG